MSIDSRRPKGQVAQWYLENSSRDHDNLAKGFGYTVTGFRKLLSSKFGMLSISVPLNIDYNESYCHAEEAKHLHAKMVYDLLQYNLAAVPSHWIDDAIIHLLEILRSVAAAKVNKTKAEDGHTSNASPENKHASVATEPTASSAIALLDVNPVNTPLKLNYLQFNRLRGTETRVAILSTKFWCPSQESPRQVSFESLKKTLREHLGECAAVTRVYLDNWSRPKMAICDENMLNTVIYEILEGGFKTATLRTKLLPPST